MRRLRRRLLFFAALFAGTVGPAWSALQIEITRGLESATPIAVARFGWSGSGPASPEPVSAVIAADLARSGRFAPLQELPQHPLRKEDVRWSDWRRLRVGSLVIGSIDEVVRGGAREYRIEYRLFDTFTGAQLAGKRYRPVHAGRLRWVAHLISDEIYYALTGESGAFATRIAYVTEDVREGEVVHTLNVADSDGGNPVVLLTSPYPIMSPSWSPEGSRLAYVSFEGRRSRILVQELATGLRREITAFPGINGAPAFSPDGRRLAVVLSHEGSPDLYVMDDLESGELRRLTSGPDIDTEPAWSPDGRTLVFTSNRSGGRPQLFRVPASGDGAPQRLTFTGRYNARAAFSPDGSRLAFVHETGGDYRIAVMEIGDESIEVITNGRLDESPTFAPNGRLILYAATDERGRSALAAVSTDGGFRQRLSIDSTGVREPAWSPRLSGR